MKKSFWLYFVTAIVLISYYAIVTGFIDILGEYIYWGGL